MDIRKKLSNFEMLNDDYWRAGETSKKASSIAEKIRQSWVEIVSEFDRMDNQLHLVWINGAKNPPISGEKVVIRPSNNKGCYHWEIVSTSEKRDWTVLYWIYLDSFPMPEDPI